MNIALPIVSNNGPTCIFLVLNVFFQSRNFSETSFLLVFTSSFLISFFVTRKLIFRIQCSVFLISPLSSSIFIIKASSWIKSSKLSSGVRWIHIVSRSGSAGAFSRSCCTRCIKSTAAFSIFPAPCLSIPSCSPLQKVSISESVFARSGWSEVILFIRSCGVFRDTTVWS